MTAVGVQPMAERIRLRIGRAAVELTLGEAMRIRDHLSAAIDLVRDGRSVLADRQPAPAQACLTA